MGEFAAAVRDHLIVLARVLLPGGQERLLRLAGLPVPAAVSLRMVIDTGSKRSTLLPGIIAHLQPIGLGAVRLETAAAATQTALFWVRLEFPASSLAPIPELAVARLPLPPSLGTFQGLIGRDVLSRWHSFTYEGLRRRFQVRDTPGGLFGWFRRRPWVKM